MNVICLDAEFADNEELLELSAFNLAGEEVYHSYYKPADISDWRTDIHHITPEMVANERNFASCREEVQSLLDDALPWITTCVCLHGQESKVLTKSR